MTRLPGKSEGKEVSKWVLVNRSLKLSFRNRVVGMAFCLLYAVQYITVVDLRTFDEVVWSATYPSETDV
jgi:hypothetical protein